ncbi:unnamed protein product [Didymodactylos carnosus]|uniref:Uncharacterized protein n=1 Tax=Didymodactylos carnosus TaxID=1234261 RepID=A0A814A474_9BILA|nr:unnamed protein product [Didymodactylos carnosus]CAF3688949.1 unnamed protein product [Didymodactylos carnosus]
MERSEIRHLIKTMKQNSRKIPLKSCATIPHAPPFLLSKEYNRHCLKKSSIANELDKEFSRIRAQQPNQELSYVPPSMICRRKTPYCPINQKTKSINKEITPSPSPPPTFADLLRTVQLKPINTKKPAIKNSFNIKTQNDSNQTSSEIYENPVDNHTTQSKSSASDETDSSHQENDENTLMDYLRIKNETGWKTERLSETRLSTEKPEYATPMRKDMAITKQQTEDISTDPEVTTLSQFQPSLRLKSEQQSRSFSFCNPIIDVQQRQQQIRKDKIRPVSMFNFLHCGLTNPLPVTFQPNRNQAKDNIYATEEQIDKCIITQTDDNDGTQDINSAILQNHLDNNHLITDYFYSDFHIKSSRSSSLLHDISKVFYRRKQHLINGGEKTQRKNHRCSVM